mmetsp:Transcript_4402/g.6739  ORF Transcript_4402/g.6739 Transcript_4402/m.6739 type:complete len:197 (-) Transcript_4402:1328-1918(-)
MSYKELRQCIERGLAEGDDVANIENWIAEATALDRTMIRTLLKQLDLQCHDITIRTSQLRDEDCNLNSERTIGYFYHANENQPRRKLRPVATSSSSNLLSPLVERNLTRAAELDKIGLKYSSSKPKRPRSAVQSPADTYSTPKGKRAKFGDLDVGSLHHSFLASCSSTHGFLNESPGVEVLAGASLEKGGGLEKKE